MRKSSREGRYAERVLVGVDDVGEGERIVIWIERRAGAVWAVGRVVNPQLRESDEARPEDVVFEGFELGDALEHANEALEDDVNVLEGDGRPADARPFTRKVRPDRVPAGIRRVTGSPSRVGTLMSAPRAASGNVIGTVRVRLSSLRPKTGCWATVTST